eukprot:gnl/MRDRNA2_/MRDRNA2_80882_c0_seq1.p1 gnl/MRDRNA2_/MRDRNA2_80882_c0~~gnl/MRDRNA2_/MRDRNA2_80882_c0_seq1.p1  ORF type:complete len:400 (+),score=85.74 gnl/MRDRNA2_/MRDRNA2_80882_c0_seq1:296-1495(+)
MEEGTGAASECPEDIFSQVTAFTSPSGLESGETIVTFTDKPLILKHYEGCVKNVTTVKARGDAKHFKNSLLALQKHSRKVVKEMKDSGKPHEQIFQELATGLYENDDTLKSWAKGVVNYFNWTIVKANAPLTAKTFVRSALNHRNDLMTQQSLAHAIKEHYKDKLSEPGRWEASDDEKSKHFISEYKILKSKVHTKDQDGLTIQKRADEAKMKVWECLEEKKDEVVQNSKSPKNLTKEIGKAQAKCAKQVNASKVKLNKKKQFIFTAQIETEIKELAEIALANLGLLNSCAEYRKQMINIHMDFLDWLQENVTFTVKQLTLEASTPESVVESQSVVTSSPMSTRDMQISPMDEESESVFAQMKHMERVHQDTLGENTAEKMQAAFCWGWDDRMMDCLLE